MTPELEIVQSLFSMDTSEYKHMKDIAKKDLGKELINRIDEFLEKRHNIKPVILKKKIFEDASKVNEESINDIVDAFVHARTDRTLREIDSGSVNQVLTLFNQKIMTGVEKEYILPDTGKHGFSLDGSLEEHVLGLESAFPKIKQLYDEDPIRQQRDGYAPNNHYRPESESSTKAVRGEDHVYKTNTEYFP
ncbi:MAG: hypothetical protein HGA85_05400 [Nanoarchaeota archaeon]|nr:hypothetical protein [Nanoarchaeota archaeon]